MARMDEFGQPVGRPVSWSPPTALTPLTTTGRDVAVAPLLPEHAAGLWEALGPGRAQWTYLGPEPPTSVDDMRAIVEGYLSSPGWSPHVITDPEGVVLGMASYLRVRPALGSVEIGAISYGTRLRRNPAATEAMTLFTRHVFTSGFRRYEWKCDDLNAPSRSAALRLGFRYEGTWRNALVYKGRNRDTAWYAMTDDDWRRLEPIHTAWLAGTGDGRQAFALSEATAALWNDEERR